MPLIVGFHSGGGGSGNLETSIPKITCAFVIEAGADIPVSKDLLASVPDLTYTAAVAAQ